jgi:poly(3-hydroxybutyrate) depolymerase/chitodextrinase
MHLRYRRYRGKLRNALAISSLLTAMTLSSQASAAGVKLPAFNVDINQTSVSGLSSGGFMAVQFEVAYSSILKGAGILAGGPYFCAQGNLTTAQQPCMAANGSTNVPRLIQITNNNVKAGTIDPTSNLANHKIWMFSGTADSVVKQSVMNDLQRYYLHYVGSSNILYKKNIAAEHAMPTDFYGNSCATKGDPFINNCHYDAAGELLKWIYGGLNPKSTGILSEDHFIEFDQSEFISNPNSHSMANTGWLYVPANCADGQACKLHVVFHGCKQYPSYMYFALGSGMVTYGTTYVRNTAYNNWADTNNIIVLYPQAFNGNKNPLGCWDWWGYDDPNYATKNGNQMKAVKAMMDKIASGVPALDPPTGLKVTGSSDTSISLSWDGLSGAAGYNVYRSGMKTNTSMVAGTTYTDSDLSPGTEYRYIVKAANSSGAEGKASAEALGKTSGDPPIVPAPTNLRVGAVTDTSVALSWTGVPGVAGYDVYRSTGSGPAKVNPSLITEASYTVSGLTASTTYSFTVKSENSSGALSADSNNVTATTSATMACFTTSNFAHVRAGRAHDSRGFALANGSNANMGLDNLFFTTTLKQTGPNFYVIDHLTCP